MICALCVYILVRYLLSLLYSFLCGVNNNNNNVVLHLVNTTEVLACILYTSCSSTTMLPLQCFLQQKATPMIVSTNRTENEKDAQLMSIIEILSFAIL